MANKYHNKRCLTFLVVRKMQIKSTVEYYSTLIPVATVKTDNSKC